MDMLTEHLVPEAPKGPIVPQAQPVGVLADLDPQLDDNAVRQALAAAEANNQDPMTVTMGDLAQVKTPQEPAKAEQPSQPKIPADIPEKFLKPDGEVDVEKLQTSTRQLDEAIQKKEEVFKSVEDLWNHYKDSQKKFGGMPNVDQIAAKLPALIQQPQTPPAPQQMSDQQLREFIRRDYEADPIATTAQLIEIAIQKKLQPFEEREKDSAVRENIRQLAAKDVRVLQHYDAITNKLNSDPDLWRLKNPHKAAWLEVKEELRLGEPQTAPAQPSRAPAPILGGGTPPSTPSSSVPPTQNVLANLDRIDLRDKRQEAMADEAIRQFLSRNGR